jgi:hypothetical protein
VAVPQNPTISEGWFDEYLHDNGYSFEIEPDFDVPKRPDRLIERVGVQAVCEIKEFTTDAIQRRWPEGGSRFGSFGSDWFLTVRRQISSAAEQLEPLNDRGLPLVIVLANPRAQFLPLDPPEVIFAMYGDPAVSLTIDPATGAPASEPVLITTQHGRLAEGEGGWISAVAVLHRREHEYSRLDVIETASEEAVTLPAEILNGQHDRRWKFDCGTGQYAEVTEHLGNGDGVANGVAE